MHNVNNTYFIATDNVGTEDNLYDGQCWNVIKSMKTNKHGFRGKQLFKDDILKIGRFVFKIIDISTEGQDTEQVNVFEKKMKFEDSVDIGMIDEEKHVNAKMTQEFNLIANDANFHHHSSIKR